MITFMLYMGVTKYAASVYAVSVIEDLILIALTIVAVQKINYYLKNKA